MYDQGLPRILSQPVPVRWAGFESDTHKLQQAGWQLSAEQDISYDSIRIAMYHEALRLRAISNISDFHYREAMHDPRYARSVILPIQHMANDMRVQIIDDLTGFRAIDAQPMVAKTEIRSLEDFNIFATPMARTNEIIVDPDSVADMMGRILELQDPARQEHYKRTLREQQGNARQVEQKFHAQIISLAA